MLSISENITESVFIKMKFYLEPKLFSFYNILMHKKKYSVSILKAKQNKMWFNTRSIVNNGTSFKTTPIFYRPINENNGNSILSADMQISAKGDASY